MTNIRTLIPLPPLQPIDVVSVDDDRINFVLVNLFHRPARLLAQRLLRLPEDQVDLARDRLRRLRVVARDHHDLDAREAQRADRLTHAVLRRVLELDEPAEAVLRSWVPRVRLGELEVGVVHVAGQQLLGARDDSVPA